MNMYTMWYERVSRWYKNGWYEKTLVRKTRYSIDSLNQLKSLDINKVSLGLPTKLLRECAEEIAPPLCRLFNMSYEVAAFPEKWKDTNLVPIHKSDSKSLVVTIGAFQFLMCFLNYWRGKFIVRSLVLYPLILCNGSIAFCQAVLEFIRLICPM